MHSLTPGPPRYKIAILTWIAIYPAITSALALIEPLGLLRLPLALRTLILTAILVPAMVFVLVPAVTHAFARWLQAASENPSPALTHNRPHGSAQ